MFLFKGYKPIIRQNGQKCDTKLLDLPENGKAWIYLHPRAELVCNENFELEKGLFSINIQMIIFHFSVSIRDFHRCKSIGIWDSPFKVVVKCKFNPLMKMETMMEEIHLGLEKLKKQSSDTCE